MKKKKSFTSPCIISPSQKKEKKKKTSSFKTWLTDCRLFFLFIFLPRLTLCLPLQHLHREFAHFPLAMIYCSHSGLILDLERGKQQRTWPDCKASQRKALLWESAWLICIWIRDSRCRSRCGSLINRPCPLFLHSGLLIYVSALLWIHMGRTAWEEWQRNLSWRSKK